MSQVKNVRPVVCSAGMAFGSDDRHGVIRYIKLMITAEKPDDWVTLIVKDNKGVDVFKHRALAMSSETFFDFTGGPLQCDRGFFTKKAENCKVQYYT